MSRRAAQSSYLLDGSSQLALNLQAEALDVADEQFTVLTLQGGKAGAVSLAPEGIPPPLRPELGPALPCPAHLH